MRAHIISSFVLAAAAAIAIVLAPSLAGSPASSIRSSDEAQSGAMPEDELDGKDLRLNDSHRPKVEASFTRESYGPGSRARLVFVSTAKNVTLQFFRAGAQHRAIRANDVMLGKSVSSITRLGAVSPRRSRAVRIGNWPSGMYFARLTARGGRVGFAPFVLHPRRLGEHRVAVVLSTQTWQAYNFRDENHDNVGDTWYADWRHKTLRLGRAYLNRGVPSHYKYYEDPFLRWLLATGKDVDYLSDSDLDRVRSGRELARDYVLIIFPGHHEYVTTNEYNNVTSFRNLGGNLMFMSADNFYWRVTRHGGYMTKTRSWRSLGRPESSLIGVQYLANDHGTHRGPWRVRNEDAVPWLFADTHLQNGAPFGNAGIEVDHVTPHSPAQTKVVAMIPNVFRPGISAYMTYYETPGGAKVFAAGAFSLATSIWRLPMRQMVENLWTKLTSDQDTGGAR